MFLLSPDATWMRLGALLAGVTVEAAPVGPPPVAGPAQRPLSSFAWRASRRCGGRFVAHEIRIDEIVLFQPDSIELADAYAEVLPG